MGGRDRERRASIFNMKIRSFHNPPAVRATDRRNGRDGADDGGAHPDFGFATSKFAPDGH